MRIRTAIALVALVAGACGGDGSGEGGPRIVVTTTVLGDVAANVAGDAARLEVLLPIGADPHDFELSSRQVAALQEADLVVANGLDLEEGMEDALDAAASQGVRVLRVGPLLEPDWLGDSVRLDPHVWMDPLRMALAAELIATELTVLDPTGPWDDNVATYRARLEALDAEIMALVETIPPERRLLVTYHDSLRYFAKRYGFEVVGVVVPGGSTLAQPSSAALSALIDVVRDRSIPAVFGETTEPSSLLDAIAAEPGLEVAVVKLFSGSLGEPGSGADTYVGMMRVDAMLIAEALG